MLLFRNPEAFLPALLAGGERAGTLCLALLAVYGVWLGFFAMVEDARLDRSLARWLRPVLSALFRTRDERALSAISNNLTANLLGLGGAATPAGVTAAGLLADTSEREHDCAMLFVLNATSLQLLPTTVLSLRLQYASASPYDILLPTLIATLFSTLAGVLAVKLLYRKKCNI